MRKTLSLPLFPQEPLDEQCNPCQSKNLSPQIPARILLFLATILSIGKPKAPKNGIWPQDGKPRTKAPEFARLVGGGKVPSLTNASALSTIMMSSTNVYLSNRSKHQRESLGQEPRLNRRLGFLRFCHCTQLFFLKILGTNSKFREHHILRRPFHDEENWGGSYSPLWRGYNRPRLSAKVRLLLSFSLPKFQKFLWCTHFSLNYFYILAGSTSLCTSQSPLSSSLSSLCTQLLSFSSHPNNNIKNTAQRGSKAPMEKEKRSFKKVLCSDASFSKEQSSKDPYEDNVRTTATRVDSTFKGSSSSRPFEASSSGSKREKGKAKAKIDMVAFLSKLSGVKENISQLKETSLYAFVLGDSLEISKLRIKLRGDWKIKGDFFVHVRSHGWFELRFTNPIEKNRVWDGRPYHVFGQLMILRPWKSNFDPASEPISLVDVWVRIPRLPVEYLSLDILSTIMEWNHLGEVIKLDTYTEKKQRLRYARLCIHVDLALIDSTKIVVPDEHAIEHEYKVWFEDFPKGCGTCGDLSHSSPNCPLKDNRKKAVTVTLPKPSSSKTQARSQHGAHDEASWKFVGKTRPPSEGKGKAPLEELDYVPKSGIQVIYKTESSSSGSKESKFSNCSNAPYEVQRESDQVKDPTVGTNEEQAHQTEVPHPPNDDKNPEIQLFNLQENPSQQDNEEEENALDLVNDFLMNEEEADYEGEFSQEELEAFIDQELEEVNELEDSQPLELFHSFSNTDFVVQKLEQLDVIPALPSTSESSKRKGSSGGDATATSSLRGGEPKRSKK